jgi:hypothetical protein
LPGTPPTSPRFGVSRPADTDTAQFSVQVCAVIDQFDANVERRFTPLAATVNTTASNHQIVTASGGVTVTLPAPTSEHELIAVVAKDDASGVSGSTPVTISTGGTNKIYGKGLGTAGVTSIVLGTPGAFVWLFSYDGTNWRIVKGERDTGWVAITAISGVNNAVSGNYPATYRQRGDMVELAGVLLNNTGGTIAAGGGISGAGALPSPVDTVIMLAVQVSIQVTNFGTIKVASFSSLGNGSAAYLDGLSYRLS